MNLKRWRARRAQVVPVDPRTAQLIGRLAAELTVPVAIRPAITGTAVYLCDPKTGENLLDPGPGHPIHPAMIAVVPADPDRPIAAYLEPVPGTTVSYGGNLDGPLPEVAERLIRHYRPAFTG